MTTKKLNKLANILEKNFKDNEKDFKFLLKYRIKSNQNEKTNLKVYNSETGEAKG